LSEAEGLGQSKRNTKNLPAGGWTTVQQEGEKHKHQIQAGGRLQTQRVSANERSSSGAGKFLDYNEAENNHALGAGGRLRPRMF
jgi:hypothetical protein